MSTQHIYKTLETVVNALNDLGNRVNTLANEIVIVKGQPHDLVPTPVPAPPAIDYSTQIASIEAKLVKMDAQESKKMFENVLMIKVEALVSKMLKDRVEAIKNDQRNIMQILKKEIDEEIAAIKKNVDGLRSEIQARANTVPSSSHAPAADVSRSEIVAHAPVLAPAPTLALSTDVDQELAALITPETKSIHDDSFQVDIVNTKKKSIKKSNK